MHSHAQPRTATHSHAQPYNIRYGIRLQQPQQREQLTRLDNHGEGGDAGREKQEQVRP